MTEEVNFSPPPTPKTSLTIPLLLFLSIFSLAISGYLFWQNQLLKQQLVAIPTPNASLIGSPQPATETVDPTANWKTYKNEKYNFSFKYPETEKLIEKKFGEVGEYANIYLIYIGSLQDQQNYVDKDGYSLNISIYERTGKDRLLLSIKNYDKNQCYPTFKCTNIESEQFSGLEAKTYSLTDGVLNITNYFIENNNYFYSIETKFTNFEDYKIKIDQILSTFKFTQ